MRWSWAAGVAVLGLVLAGCGGHGSGGVATPVATGGGAGSTTTTVAVPSRSLAVPGCSAAVARTSTLTALRTSTAGSGAQPFGVAVSRDGRYLFVAGDNGIAVFSLSGAGAGGLSSTPLRTVGLPGGSRGYGIAITPDGRYVLVAVDSGLVVLAVAALEHGGPAVAGSLVGAGRGGIEVTASPDGRYAFVSFEDSDDVGVFDVARALQDGFGASGLTVGTVAVGQAPVGIIVSPDGRYLFVTSESDPAAGPGPAGSGNVVDCAGGSLSVIDAGSAETDPGSTGRVVTAAGASPVRVALGDGGAIAWVTARGSDALLGFSTARLTAASPGQVVSDALVAIVPVGSAPVGVTTADGGRLVVVADSNRFAGAGGEAQWLSVVDAGAALAGRPALLGQVPAGAFPRDLAVSPDGSTVFVSNFESRDIEAVAVGGVPG